MRTGSIILTRPPGENKTESGLDQAPGHFFLIAQFLVNNPDVSTLGAFFP